MSNEDLILLAMIGGLGGLLGSIVHLLSQHNFRKKLYSDPLNLWEDVANSFGWTVAAMGAGATFSWGNPLAGFVIGLLTGVFGVEGYKRLATTLRENQQISWLLERNKGVKSIEALQKKLVKLDFLQDVKIVEKIGEIDIAIIPERIYNSAKHLPILYQLLDLSRPMGVKLNVVEPQYVEINLTANIIVREGANVEDTIKRTNDFITNHINNLAIGESFRLPLLQSEIIHGKVKDVEDILNVVTVPALNDRQAIAIPTNKLSRAGKILITKK